MSLIVLRDAGGSTTKMEPVLGRSPETSAGHKRSAFPFGLGLWSSNPTKGEMRRRGEGTSLGGDLKGA